MVPLVLILALGLIQPVHAQDRASDRAGVRTVEAGRTADVQEWFIGSEPVLSIGMVDGPEEYLFMNPRRGTVLEDGTVVVQDSNRGTFELRFFDEAGTHLRSVGRWGDGPWEFRAWADLHRLSGDSLMVLDPQGKFAVWSSSGERIREGRHDLLEIQPILSTDLMDAEHTALKKSGGEQGMPDDGFQQSDMSHYVLEHGTGRVEPLGSLAWERAFFEVSGNAARLLPIPFNPESNSVAGGGRLWVGLPAQGEVLSYDTQGELVLVIRFNDTPRRVTRQDRRRFEEVMLDGLSGDDLRRYRRHARRVEYPEAMPPFGQLTVDVGGNLWVERYHPPWNEGGQTWDVFSKDGERVATATLPRELLSPCARRLIRPCNRILEIGDDYVLMDVGRATGVRYVVKYPLRRSSWTKGGEAMGKRTSHNDGAKERRAPSQSS